MKRDFLTLSDLSHAEHEALFLRASLLKVERNAGRTHTPTLAGKTLALVFEKASTRTRLSFEAAMLQLGGHTVVLDTHGSQMGRGEPIVDTARVTSRYVDIIMFRTFGDDRLAQFARASQVPVVNGLSDGAHPVQLLADLMTVRERLGPLKGKRVAFIGDGAGNMAASWIEAANLFDFELRIAAPAAHRPTATAKGFVVGGDPREAIRGADVIVTDVWASMGQEDEAAKRRAEFDGFTVDHALCELARPHAIVLHCLPAHRGEEITDEVIEGPCSAVFDEAENRLHAQKALLELLMGVAF